jgi:predicted RNase H-like nuclease (RuvC/YqgF family)
MSFANLWYKLVARRLQADHTRLVSESIDLNVTIKGLERTIIRLEVDLKNVKATNDKLRTDINTLEHPTFVGSWVGAQAHAAKQRNTELERQLGKMDLVRQALKNEKAYTLFLEDCLLCNNPSDIFNALPLEKRKEYFDKVQ